MINLTINNLINQKVELTSTKDKMELVNEEYYRRGNEWLTRDSWRCWTWEACPALRTLVVQKRRPVTDMLEEGFLEIADGVYMLEYEAANVPSYEETASATFCEAEDTDVAFVASVHRAVGEWPSCFPDDAPGSRLWSKINELEKRYKAKPS